MSEWGSVKHLESHNQLTWEYSLVHCDSGEKLPLQHIRRDIFHHCCLMQGHRELGVTRCLETGRAGRLRVWQLVGLGSQAGYAGVTPSCLPVFSDSSSVLQSQCDAAPFPSVLPFLWTPVSLQRQSLLWWRQRETLLQWQRDESERPLSGFCDRVTKENSVSTFARPTVHVG